MGRKVPILALFIVGLQVCEILILGTSRVGSLVANSLQTIACVLGIAMALGASQRGRGLSRPFWLMIGAGLATWGIANLGWMYYENWLHQEIPTLSITRVLFDTDGVFFAIALFLDKDRDSPRFDIETALDALQVGIVFFSTFFGMYYVQLLSGGVNPYADLELSGNECGADGAGVHHRIQFADGAIANSVWRTGTVPNDQYGVFGDGRLDAERRWRADGHMVRHWVESTVSGVRGLGCAMEGGAGGIHDNTPARKNTAERGVQECGAGSGAIAGVTASGATGRPVAGIRIRAGGGLNRVLRGAAGTGAVSRRQNRSGDSAASDGHGFGDGQHGDGVARRQVHVRE
jgi:hypothetical protein